MRWKIALAAFALVLIVVGAWQGYVRVDEPTIPSEISSALTTDVESALAVPGLLAIVSVDVEQAVSVEEIIQGKPKPVSTRPVQGGGSWFDQLRSAGFDPRRDLSSLVGVLYLDASGDLQHAYIMFGRFQPEEYYRVLSAEFDASEKQLRGKPALYLQRVNEETCEKGGVFAVLIESDRVIAASSPAAINTVLTRLEEPAVPSVDLARWRSFRGGKLAGVALFPPDSVPDAVSNPFARMGAEAASTELDGFVGVYFGAAMELVPPSVELSLVLAASDEQNAQELAKRWQQKLAGWEASAETDLPLLASLTENVDIEADGAEMLVNVALDKDWLGDASRVPGEFTTMLFGGLGLSLPEGDMPSEEERVDDNPLLFRSEYPVSELGTYDQNGISAEKVSQVSGPFGFRVASVALGDDSTAGPILEVEAFGTGIDNLGHRTGRAALYVEEITAPDGGKLLHEAHCGEYRAGHPAELRMNGRDLKGSKTVRLQKAVSVEEVAKIAGYVELKLPVQTESVRLSQPSPGMTLEREGVHLEITEVRPSSFAYRISGDADKVLHFQALNAENKPLASTGSSSSGMFFGDGETGTSSFAGQIAQIEVILAVAEEVSRHPFVIDGAHPLADQEHTVTDSRDFVPYSYDRLQEEFSQPVIPPEDNELQAHAAAGPFSVALEEVSRFMGLAPRLVVRAPRIPNIESSLQGVELRLKQVRMKDGTVHRIPADPGMFEDWSDLLSFSNWGEENLRASTTLATGIKAEVAQVQSLRGSLVLSLPKEIETLSLQPVQLGSAAANGSVEVTIVKLGRDGVTLRVPKGGERVLGLKAFNAQGDELWVPFSNLDDSEESGWLGTFSVSGQPDRLDVIVARLAEKVEYSYLLNLEP